MKKSLITLLPLFLFAYTINFDRALDEAYKNNYELKAKKINIDLAKIDASKAKSYNYGNFYFTETAVKSDSLRAQTMGYTSQTGEVHYTSSITYEIYFFKGYELVNAQKISKLQIKAKKYQFLDDKNKLALEVLKAYNGVVAAKYFITALNNAKQTTSSFVEMTHRLYKQGLIVYSDVLSTEERDREVSAQLLEANNQYKLALTYLRFLTGDYTISNVNDFKILIAPDNNLKTLQNFALKHRPDLKKMKINVLMMNKKVKMTESIKYPTLEGYFEWSIPDHHIDRDNYTMALASKYYFLTPDKKELNKAKIQSHQIALYYEHMKNGIKLDVEQKYLKLKANTALIKNKQKTAQAANTILQQYKEMYRSGLINIAILLLKQAEAQKADAELIKAKFDQTVSAAELKIAIGSPIKPDIDSIKLIYKEER